MALNAGYQVQLRGKIELKVRPKVTLNRDTPIEIFTQLQWKVNYTTLLFYEIYGAAIKYHGWDKTAVDALENEEAYKNWSKLTAMFIVFFDIKSEIMENWVPGP